MILTCGGIKGGVGKSLISINLVVMRSKDKKVLLVDADDQHTASDWAGHRMNMNIPTTWTTIRLREAAVSTEVLKLASSFDDIIIDCGGRDTKSLRAALAVSDMFLIPFQPASFDIWTLNQVNELVNEVKIFNPKLKCYAFINRGESKGSDNESAQLILSKSIEVQLLPAVIGHRKAFGNSISEGLGIIELNKDFKAQQEMSNLYDLIYDIKLTS